MRTLYFVFILLIIVFFVTGSVLIWSVTRKPRQILNEVQEATEEFFKVGRHGKTLILETQTERSD